MKSAFILIYTAMSFTVNAQNMPAYRLFEQGGKKVNYDKMIKDLAEADVVLFGENHNNALVHWLQLQVTKSMYAQQPELVLAAEMFEADDQLILNEYLAGKYDEKMFAEEAKLWKNYTTDYKPLLDFAKQNNLAFVASNIPRRYARMVYKRGIESLDSLDVDAKAYIAPLPITIDLSLPGYKNMIDNMGSHAPRASIENMARSQACKDATMAYFILKSWEEGRQAIHYNGAYHSNNFDGISHYLKQYNPSLKIITLTMVDQDTIESLEDGNLNLANYIFAIPADMAKTY